MEHKQLLPGENGISRSNLNYLCLSSLWHDLFYGARTHSGGTIFPDPTAQQLFLMSGAHLACLESRWDVQTFSLAMFESQTVSAVMEQREIQPAGTLDPDTSSSHHC